MTKYLAPALVIFSILVLVLLILARAHRPDLIEPLFPWSKVGLFCAAALMLAFSGIEAKNIFNPDGALLVRMVSVVRVVMYLAGSVACAYWGFIA